ncbi:arabinosyltransferase domain-containing protein [Mariniluteicoccus flavus]
MSTAATAPPQPHPAPAEPTPTGHRALWVVTLVLALLAGLAMAAVPFAPVTQHTATYRWDSQKEVALPLSPHRPERVRLTLECAKFASAGQGHLLTTSRSVDPDLAAKRLDLTVRGTDLEVRSNGHTMVWRDVMPCTRLDLDLAEDATRLWSRGEPRQTFPGDHRPTVDGFSYPARDLESRDQSPPGSWVATPTHGANLDGFSAVVVADTQWDTSPTPLKLALMGLSGALLAAAIACALIADPRTRAPAPTRAPRARPRPTPDDAVLAALVATGVVIGGANDDDGFISQIIRTREMSGYIGNYARWANAPEAPFGWFYELLSRWGAVSMEPVWLRLLPAAVALVGWVVLRHGLFPRLVPRPSRASRAVLVTAYAGVWLVFGNSLRPEVWYATGLGVVLLCVLVALERRAVWPLLVGALVAGLSVGTNPTGVVALATFVLLARPLARWLRTLPLRGVPVVAACLACVGAIVPIAFADQSFAAVISAAHARAAFGPIFPWWQDSRRYWMLWQSLAARQVAVFLPAVAMAALGWFWWRTRRAGQVVPDGVQRTLAGVVAACAPALALAMLLGPTKLPHHFGGLMLVGPLAMAAATHLLRSNALRASASETRSARFLAPLLLGGSLIALGAALHGNNIWWKLSSLGMVADRRPLALGPVPLWAVVVLAGIALTIALALARRPLRHAATAYAVVLALVLAGQLANFAQAAVRRGPDRYTLGSAALAAIAGDGCRLERSLHVESGPPAQSVLTADGPNPFQAATPADLPTWQTDGPATMTTGWYALPTRVTKQRWPVVIRATGLDIAHRVRVEFDRGVARDLPVPRQTEVVRPEASDIPVTPPAGATRLRLVATADTAVASDPATGLPRTFRVGQPRVPRTEPLLDLARNSRVAIAWNLAFFAPCLQTPRQAHGAVELPRHLLSDSVRPGNMSYTARDGGPFAAARGLTTAVRVPVYSAGDNTEPTITSLELVRLDRALGDDTIEPPEVGTRVRQGWSRLPAVP